MPSSVHLGVLTHPFSTNPPTVNVYMSTCAQILCFYGKGGSVTHWLTSSEGEAGWVVFFVFYDEEEILSMKTAE